MAAVEGLYLTDDKDQLIFQFAPTSTAPSFSTLITSIKAVSHTNTSHHQITNDSIIDVSQNSSVYKTVHGRVNLLAYVNTGSKQKALKLSSLNDDEDEFSDSDDEEESKDQNQTKSSQDTNVINPIFIFSLLNQIYLILTNYLGTPLKPLKLEQNYDILCNLVQDILQSGFPYITDINVLKDNTPNRESLGAKIISTTNQIAKSYTTGSNISLSSLASQGSGSGRGNKFNGISSSSLQALPWRNPGIKYTNNELFLDITETLNVVLTPSHKTIKNPKKLKFNSYNLHPRYATITGSLDFVSHLSGMPEVQLILNLNGHSLGLPSLHRCVDLRKYADFEGLLNFTPPDGGFRLMDYVIDVDSYPISKALKNLGIIDIEYKENLGLKSNEFEISLNLKMNTKINSVQGLRVGIKLRDEQADTMKVLRVSHGDFQIKGGNGGYEWVFDDDLKLGINPVLRCSIESESTPEVSLSNHEEGQKVAFPIEVSLNYSNKGALASGVKVDSLKVLKGLSDNVKPFKGVKYITETGDFVIR